MIRNYDDKSRDSGGAPLSTARDKLFDDVPVGYLTLNGSGIISVINLTGARLLATERSTLRGRPFAPFVAKEDLPVFLDFLYTIQKNRCKESCELTILVDDAVPLAIRVVATISPSGDTFHLVLMDISGQKQAEGALLAGQRLFRTLAQGASVGIFRADSQGECVYVNQRWQEITGLGYDEALFTGWERAIHPDDRERLFSGWRRCMEQRLPFDMEYRFLRPDGVVTWVRGQALAELDDLAGVTSYVGTITDITPQKVMEEQRRAGEAHLNEAQRLTKLGSWKRDLVRGLISWSDEMYKICQVDPSHFTPSFDSYRSMVHPEDLPFLIQTVQDAHADRIPYELEYRLLMPDGGCKWIAARGSATYDLCGKLLTSTGTVQDITQRKKTELTLQSYSRRLVDLEEEVRRTLAAELHDELGPDLTALNFTLALIKNDVQPERRIRLAALMADSTELVDGLSGKVRNIIARLQPPVLFSYGLAAALRWYAGQMKRRTGMIVAVVTERGFPRLPADRELAMFRVAKEALTNAAKYSGGEKMMVRLRSGESFVRLTVADDGAGFTLPATPRPGGGWGLSIMRMRAEMLGGTFHLKTKPGRGTVIHIVIPREVPHVD